MYGIVVECLVEHKGGNVFMSGKDEFSYYIFMLSDVLEQSFATNRLHPGL